MTIVMRTVRETDILNWVPVAEELAQTGRPLNDFEEKVAGIGMDLLTNDLYSLDARRALSKPMTGAAFRDAADDLKEKRAAA